MATRRPPPDPIVTIADVSVSIDAPAVVMPGSPITWSVDLTNAGPSDAANTVVTIPVPDGVTITGLDPDGPCVLVGSVITCTFGVLSPGETTTLTFTGDTDPDGNDPIELTANAVSDTDDPDGTNNDASIAVDRVPVAELSVTQSFDDDSIPYFGSTSLAVNDPQRRTVARSRCRRRPRDPCWSDGADASRRLLDRWHDDHL